MAFGQRSRPAAQWTKTALDFSLERDLCHDFRMAQRHVKLTGDVEGSYVIEESLADGRLVVAPEWPSKETSVEAILDRAGGERMSPEDFDKHFGHLPTDGEG